MREPVLLPPVQATRPPLPGWVTAVALIGLFVLGASTIPTAWRRARLLRGHAALRCETARQEHRLRRLELEVRAARRDSFARERALRSLLLPPPSR